jgi:hypothetical protein
VRGVIEISLENFVKDIPPYISRAANNGKK